jgi:hypothetical protein
MLLTYLFGQMIMSAMLSICSSTSSHHHRQHVQIYWNSSNTLFHNSGFLTVYLGDLIDFICPHYEQDHWHEQDELIEYNTLYLVNENDYHHCNTRNYQPLLRCNRPFDEQPLIYTLSISRYLPYPNVPEFDDGQFYYFISTSTGSYSQMDQRHDGLCRTKSMKLIINVEKYYRHSLGETRRWPKPIIAKRTNWSLSDRTAQHLSSFALTSRAFNCVLFFVLVLLITWPV